MLSIQKLLLPATMLCADGEKNRDDYNNGHYLEDFNGCEKCMGHQKAFAFHVVESPFG